MHLALNIVHAIIAQLFCKYTSYYKNICAILLIISNRCATSNPIVTLQRLPCGIILAIITLLFFTTYLMKNTLGQLQQSLCIQQSDCCTLLISMWECTFYPCNAILQYASHDKHICTILLIISISCAYSNLIVSLVTLNLFAIIAMLICSSHLICAILLIISKFCALIVEPHDNH